MWVKICGNTNIKDAALAIELGADAVGFVFAPSKRQVTAAQVAAITSHLSAGVELVGVFDSHDPDEIAQIVMEAGLTTAQLHGGFNEELLAQLGERLAGKARVIQTLHWAVGEESHAERLAGQIDRVAVLGIADRVLIDSKVSGNGGGTGVGFDWVAARGVFASARNDLRLIVAGGLTPENVAEAITQLRPSGVDVASGVEASPGRKDPARLARFIENVRAAATP
jgi:phosphoribosylanthranilate isomerase